MIPGKDGLFVVDFVNDAEDIYRSFKLSSSEDALSARYP
jgi:hypothetical protein